MGLGWEQGGGTRGFKSSYSPPERHIPSFQLTVWTRILEFLATWIKPQWGVPCGPLMTWAFTPWTGSSLPSVSCRLPLDSLPMDVFSLPWQSPLRGAEGAFSACGLLIPWLLCWAIQQGCQFFHLADYYIALKREGFILAGCYIDCYRDVSIFTGCYIDWEKERGRIAGSCHIDCYRKDLYLSSTSALGSPRQDINANSSAHPLLWVLFV